MKPALLLFVSLLAQASALAQGSVQFSNCGGPYAPVYGVTPSDPATRHTGNAVTNGGIVDYTGYPLLQGTGYTASLWAAPEGTTDLSLFEFLAAVSFSTRSDRAGCFVNPSVTIPWTTYEGQPVGFVVRAWDNRGGSVTTWAQASADTTVARGYSDIFIVGVSIPPGPPTPLYSLTSFNLTVVPEPGVLALGLLGGGLLGLVLFSTKRATKDHG